MDIELLHALARIGRRQLQDSRFEFKIPVDVIFELAVQCRERFPVGVFRYRSIAPELIDLIGNGNAQLEVIGGKDHLESGPESGTGRFFGIGRQRDVLELIVGNGSRHHITGSRILHGLHPVLKKFALDGSYRRRVHESPSGRRTGQHARGFPVGDAMAAAVGKSGQYLLAHRLHIYRGNGTVSCKQIDYHHLLLGKGNRILRPCRTGTEQKASGQIQHKKVNP